MSHSILLIDDDDEVLFINKKFFEQLHYQVFLASSAQEVQKILTQFNPDCIVLDIMLPEVDGYEICKSIKAHYNIPIIFLSGKDSENDKIHGLLLGDDYMVKPYSLRELEARIQVQIRRHQLSPVLASNSIDYPPLHIDLIKGTAYCNDEEIALSQKEYTFLRILAETPNQVFTFEDLGNQIWGSYLDSDRKTIMVTASRLRKKLDTHPGLQNCIETVWSKGYKFVKK